MAHAPSAFHQDLVDDNYLAHVGFLLAELDLSLTFAELAQTSTRAEDRARNYANAQTGYETVGRFYGRLGAYTPADQVAIDEKRERLRQQLSALGGGIVY